MNGAQEVSCRDTSLSLEHVRSEGFGFRHSVPWSRFFRLISRRNQGKEILLHSALRPLHRAGAALFPFLCPVHQPLSGKPIGANCLARGLDLLFCVVMDTARIGSCAEASTSYVIHRPRRGSISCVSRTNLLTFSSSAVHDRRFMALPYPGVAFSRPRSDPSALSQHNCRLARPGIRHCRSLGRRHRRQTLTVASAAAIQLTEEQIQREGLPTAPRPAALPPPPAAATLLHVMPYLCKLALGDRQLYWRLAAALLLMLVSKGAGAVAS